jgi:hypothetical protein
MERTHTPLSVWFWAPTWSFVTNLKMTITEDQVNGVVLLWQP